MFCLAWVTLIWPNTLRAQSSFVREPGKKPDSVSSRCIHSTTMSRTLSCICNLQGCLTATACSQLGRQLGHPGQQHVKILFLPFHCHHKWSSGFDSCVDLHSTEGFPHQLQGQKVKHSCRDKRSSIAAGTKGQQASFTSSFSVASACTSTSWSKSCFSTIRSRSWFCLWTS